MESLITPRPPKKPVGSLGNEAGWGGLGGQSTPLLHLAPFDWASHQISSLAKGRCLQSLNELIWK